MEVPAAAVLYALLLAATAGTLLYVFTVYDNAVYEINYAACQEAVTLLKLALQRAEYEVYNYTGYIELYYPAIMTYENGVIYLTVGHDTRQPAQCQLRLSELNLKTPTQVLGGTGTRIAITKQVVSYGKCEDAKLPALAKKDGKLLVAHKCEEGLETAAYVAKIYIS